MIARSAPVSAIRTPPTALMKTSWSYKRVHITVALQDGNQHGEPVGLQSDRKPPRIAAMADSLTSAWISTR